MASSATRLQTLLMLLQRQPSQKVAGLAEALGVSVRTLHRYLATLEEMGVPIYTERGPHGGVSLVQGYRLPPMIFTPEEAVAMFLGTSVVGQMWGELYREPAQGAMVKLDNVLPTHQRDEVAWARRSLIATGMHRADPVELSPRLETLRSGARSLRSVGMTYLGGTDPAETDRLVDPYALIFRSGWWYLVGFCHLRQAMRTFRVDRIRNLALTENAFVHLKDFGLQHYLDSAFADQPVVRARLRFVPEAAHMAAQNLWGLESVETLPDGSVDIVLGAPDMVWLASMALSFASWVTVLDPPELRDMVRDWARAVVALYPDTTSSSRMPQ